MKGKYHIIIQNNRIKFEFDIKRNITIIRGDSATGKTTLMNLIETYERQGEESGITVSCNRKCKTLNNSNWENVIEQSQDCIIFIDEETNVIKTNEFATKIKDSSNYYVIITRENLSNLPYSVEEIYGIKSSGKYSRTERTYNSFYNLYSSQEFKDNECADIVIVEDTNAGYDFYNNISGDNIKCISAGGKTAFKAVVKDYKNERVLIIADGAAFGAEMNELYLYIQNNTNVGLYLPESFEWVILSSGLIDGNRIADILASPEDYIESKDFFSWEQYFTRLLVSETTDTYLQYNKGHLNKNYLEKKQKDALIKVISVVAEKLGL